MLEILALVFGTRHLKKVANQRGHSGWMAALFPVLWIVFQFVAVFAAIILFDVEGYGAVCVGYQAALVGAGIAFGIVYSLPRRELEYGADPYSGASAESVNDNVWSG